MNAEETRRRLMWASFLTLVASGVGFAVRTKMATAWGAEFNLGGQQFGEILGAGFLGFGMMIFFGGILTEKFGYRNLLLVAFLLHLISAGLLFIPRPTYSALVEGDAERASSLAFWILFGSCFIFSIAQGLYEAVINPMIAQLYPQQQTHYLNILHAGWPAGMILGGLIAASFVAPDAWVYAIPLWEIPLASFAIIVLLYGFLAFPVKFPETVSSQTKSDFARLFSCFLSPIFLFLIVLHACIGYVELGVDSWVTKLMENLLPNSIIILIYTSFLMFVLRFFAGPIVHRINPIGLLFVSSVIGCVGLIWLGSDITSVAIIFAAATVYSLGKAFFWPTMLGVAGERYPQSGAIAMGALGAAGMLTVGLLANPAIGYNQSSSASAYLAKNAPATFDRYAEKDETGFLMFPRYRRLTPNLVSAALGVKETETGTLDTSSFDKLAEESGEETRARIPGLMPTIAVDSKALKEAEIAGGRRALTVTAYVPAFMALGYLVLLIYFASTGGYRKIELSEVAPPAGSEF